MLHVDPRLVAEAATVVFFAVMQGVDHRILRLSDASAEVVGSQPPPVPLKDFLAERDTIDKVSQCRIVRLHDRVRATGEPEAIVIPTKAGGSARIAVVKLGELLMGSVELLPDPPLLGCALDELRRCAQPPALAVPSRPPG